MQTILILSLLITIANTMFVLPYKTVMMYHGHTQKWKRVVMLIPPVGILVIVVASLVFAFGQLREFLAD